MESGVSSPQLFITRMLYCPVCGKGGRCHLTEKNMVFHHVVKTSLLNAQLDLLGCLPCLGPGKCWVLPLLFAFTSPLCGSTFPVLVVPGPTHWLCACSRPLVLNCRSLDWCCPGLPKHKKTKNNAVLCVDIRLSSAFFGID